MLNPFFLQGSKTEQSLIQDLINEQLRMYGVEIYYIPRRYLTTNTVIKEVIESKFDNAYPLEAYVDTYDGYEGQGTILSKFGVQPLNDLNLIISRERFESYISPLIKNIPDIELSTRPKEGDLVYFPLGDRLFEIKFVEHEKPFYQLQKNYVYELRCELFRYEDEIVDTGIEEIDDNVTNEGFIQTLTLVGLGVTATAYTGIVNGGIRSITILNRGSGYTSAPRVAISSAPPGGITAVGIATMIGGIIECNGTNDTLKVQGVQLINPGYGYTVAPGVVFVGGGGAGAAATVTIGNGIVGVVTISNGGSGYIKPPVVTFSGPGVGTGVTATGFAYINNSGVVTSILLSNTGLGYTQSPIITIQPPPSSGIGTYKVNEKVVGSISNSTAVVRSWDSVTRKLKIGNLTGEFIPEENIVGQTSGASYKLAITDTRGFNTVDAYAQNDEIEDESDSIVDFSEVNPFGTP